MRDEDRAEVVEEPCPFDGTDACDHCKKVCPNHRIEGKSE